MLSCVNKSSSHHRLWRRFVGKHVGRNNIASDAFSQIESQGTRVNKTWIEDFCSWKCIHICCLQNSGNSVQPQYTDSTTAIYLRKIVAVSSQSIRLTFKHTREFSAFSNIDRSIPSEQISNLRKIQNIPKPICGGGGGGGGGGGVLIIFHHNAILTSCGIRCWVSFSAPSRSQGQVGSSLLERIIDIILTFTNSCSRFPQLNHRWRYWLIYILGGVI